MNNGFSLLEVLIAMTISLSVLSIVISSVTDSTDSGKKIQENQAVLESIFHTVDALKTDLTKCGMRLQEAKKYFDFPVFTNSEIELKTLTGIANIYLNEEAEAGSKELYLQKDEYLKKKRKLLIYNTENYSYEFNTIEDITYDNDKVYISLVNETKNFYNKSSVIILLKSVSFKYYAKEKTLKRKIDNGYFQPMIDNVTDFYLKYFPEAYSLLYRIEVGHKEQIRGYIFLTNMVQK